MTLESILPAGMPADAAILILAGLTAFVVALAIWNTFLVHDPLGPRLKALAERRAALKAGLTAPRRRRQETQKRKARTKAKSVSFMRSVVKRINLLRDRRGKNTVNKLASAGYRSNDAPVVFVFMKVFLPIVFGATAVALIYVIKIYDVKSLYKILILAGSVGFGFYAPEIFVKNLASKRQNKLRNGLPDTIDLMVICAEAGLSMDAAFARVAREMAKSNPEIADEFGLVSIELSFLPERRMALKGLAERTLMPEFRAIVNMLVQTEKYGTPLANALRVLAAEFRNNRMMKAEEKAAKLPAVLTVPMIVFILPTLFVVLLGPAIFQMVDALGKMG